MNVCPILVGRDAEMAALVAALREGGVVLVAGEAGIGKSRLLREFAARAEDAKHVVVWGRPEAVTAPGPYSLVLDLLDDLGEVLRDGRDEARELIDLLSSPGAGKPEPPARQIAARVRGLLGRLGRPVLMAEDLHAADEPSQAVLAHLARSARDDGALLVGTYRTEEATSEGTARLLDLLTRDRLATEIELAALEPDALREMLEAMWGRAVEDGEGAEIQRLGEGIPFFIEELAGASGNLPETVARGVLMRLQRLDEAGRAVMRAAALMPGALDPAVLADACGLSEAALPAILIAAVRAGLLADQEGRLVFRHALLREAVAGGIVSLERTEVHRALAAATEKLHAGEIEPHAQALAGHHLAAGNVEEAARYFVIAGERALSVGATEDARATFERSLEHARDETIVVRAHRGLAEASFRLRDVARAIELLESVAAVERRNGRAADLVGTLIRIGHILGTAGDERAYEVFDEMTRVAEADGSDELRASVLVERGWEILHAFNDFRRAQPLLEEGLALAQDIDDVRLVSMAHDGLALVCEGFGDEDAAVQHAETASTLATSIASNELIGRTHSELAHLLTSQGRCTRALEVLEDAREHLLREAGSLLALGADATRAWILWRAGMPGEAERYAGRAEAAGLGPGHPRLVRAWAALERGDREVAYRIVQGWWEEAGGNEIRHRGTRFPEDQPEEPLKLQYAFLAEVLVRVMDDPTPDEETLFLARRFHEFCAMASADIQVLARTLDARARVRAGLADGVDEILEGGEAALGSMRMPARRAALAEVRGLLHSHEGKLEQAISSWSDAAQLYREAENQSDRARTLRLLGSALAKDAKDQGIECLREARMTAAGAGAFAEQNRVESVLRELGIRPRAGRPKGSGRKEGLSAREEEVVALVASGATNAEVAARLFLSGRTVQDHIANAQRRLGVTGRAGLAAWAAKQGLV